MLVRAGDRRLALPIASVVEVMRPPGVEPVDGVPDSILGLALVRGRPTPVVDPDRLLGGDGLRSAARLVILRVEGERVVGLLASEVPGVVDELGEAELPPLVAADRGPLAGVARRDGALALVLETARLVPEDAWQRLQGGAG